MQGRQQKMSDEYQLPCDWKNGELPFVEDIRSWIELTKLVNDSFYGPRIQIPEEVFTFMLTVSNMRYELDTYGPEAFAKKFNTEDFWTAARQRWIQSLQKHPNIRSVLAKQGLKTELDFEEFKKPINDVRIAVSDTIDNSPQEQPIPESAQKTSSQTSEDDPGVSRTFIETDFPSLLGLPPKDSADNRGTRRQDTKSVNTLYELNKVALPGENDTVSLGSGRSCGILGRGGMATVYRIYNEVLEIYRALKLMLYHRHCDNEEELLAAIRRVEMEAKIWAKLHHNNIVQVHDFGKWNGIPFLEMELVEGSDLKTLLYNRGALSPEVVTSIGIFVARALSFAHRQNYQLYGESYSGLIHRDIKPQNILCSKTGDIKLADFGLAKPSEFTTNTVVGTFVGTPQYAAPEQLLSTALDARTDIYSVGTVLYEMIAGHEMFPQESIMTIFAARQANQYKPLARVRRNVHRDLVAIVDKCTRLDSADRFGSATALLEALEDCHRKITKERPEAVLEDYVIDRALLRGQKNSTAQKTGKLNLFRFFKKE
jgi:tRNA A-37 threonylcarbamoyl transferase component Bud32